MDPYSSGDDGDSYVEEVTIPRRKNKHSKSQMKTPEKTKSSSQDENPNPVEEVLPNLSSTNSKYMMELFRTPIFENEHSNWEDSEGDGKKKFVPSKANEPKNGQQSESEIPQVMDILQGKEELTWGSKLFFRSAEMIFPGFSKYADAQNRVRRFMTIRVRSSLTLQMLLHGDLLFFVCWAFNFLVNYDLMLSILKELHGYLLICLSILFMGINILRLRFGLLGNENDDVQYLALFWMTTVIVEIPIFSFVLVTDIFSPKLLPFILTMDSFVMGFLVIETLLGFIHFRFILKDELRMIRMARKIEGLFTTKKTTGQTPLEGEYRPRIANTVKGPKVIWDYEGHDEIYSSSDESLDDNNSNKNSNASKVNTE